MLSKSRVMRGVQCAKSLYLTVHHPELAAPITENERARFENGHRVGERAQAEFPGGVLISAAFDQTALAVEETQRAMDNGAHTIFEATFSFGAVSVRVDILHRVNSQAAWQLIEVKSATSVKEEYYTDLAVQTYVVRNAGQKIQSSILMHLNSQAVAPDFSNLFIRVDVSAEVEKRISALPKLTEDLLQLLQQPVAPQISIGPHCTNPYPCSFKAHCWQNISTSSIFEFPIYAKAWDFYRQGIVDIYDPRFGPFEGVDAHRIAAVRTGKRWVNPVGIAAGLADWEWPILYLDFETMGYAVPMHEGTRPYEPVPFQFSTLFQKTIADPFEAVEYLHEDSSDPRRPLVEKLIPELRRAKSIVAYYKSFEAGCLKGLAKRFPEHAHELLAACERLVDPLPLFRQCVYDTKFRGKFSIKNVAPAILGEAASYKNMLVAEGGAAMRGFEELIDSNTSAVRKAELKAAMLAYCKKDTVVMKQLVDWLYSQRSG